MQKFFRVRVSLLVLACLCLTVFVVAQPKPATGVFVAAPPPVSTCNQTFSSTTGLATAIGSAANDTTICLNDGTYSSVTVSNAARSGYVTVRSTTGTGATLASWTINNSDFIKIQSTQPYGLRLGNCSTNIHVLDNVFVPNQQHMAVDDNGDGCSGDRAILIDGNTFDRGKQIVQEGRLTLQAANGVTVTDNVFSGTPDDGTAHFAGGGTGSDGIQMAVNVANVTIARNVFFEIDQDPCEATAHVSNPHCDMIQIYISAGSGSNLVIEENLFIGNQLNTSLQWTNCDVGAVCPPATFRQNVFDGVIAIRIAMNSGTFSHNTLYNTSFDCRLFSEFSSSGNTVQSNIFHSGDGCSFTGASTMTHNLCTSSGICGGTNQIIGTPTYVGGSPASIETWGDWLLAGGSAGENGGHDGTDVGATVVH